jgi:hypothetical protein
VVFQAREVHQGNLEIQGHQASLEHLALKHKVPRDLLATLGREARQARQALMVSLDSLVSQASKVLLDHQDYQDSLEH